MKTDSQNYQVLARRFRPQQFPEILGQETLVTALSHALQQGRVGHAYLFCGPRGVGKTTVARIFAKALNCAKGPTATPCDQCQNCKEITNGNALDVLEIDGASNRGIDEIRNLRENVQYTTACSLYKIYIIDEVHMLTQEAFNALLKTLEEPPAHVKFFFATTDPQKLPATILSRCQKFELRRLTSALLIQRLKTLAQSEKTRLTEDALLAIVGQAQGSMRDAESLLEVLIASGQKEINFALVRDTLGLSDQEIFCTVTEALCKGQTKRILEIVAELFYQGKEPARFLAGFTGHLRNLLLAKVLGEKANALELPGEQIQKLLVLGAGVTQEQLIGLLDLSSRTETQMRGATNTRIVLELFLMKALEFLARPPLRELIARLEKLETRLGGECRQSDALPRQEIHPTPIPSAPSTPGADRPVQQTSLYEQEDIASNSGSGGTDIKSQWVLTAQSLGSTHPVIKTCMQDATTLILEGDQLSVGLKKGANFQKSTLQDKSYQALIEQKLQERLGRSIKIKVDFLQNEDGPESKKPTRVSENTLANDPAVLDALSILSGKIVRTSKG